jgi:flagellar motor switch protein FliN
VESADNAQAGSLARERIPFTVPVLHADRHPHTAFSKRELQRILRLEVPVIVKLAERKLSLADILQLDAGAIIRFSKSSDEPLELLINNKRIGVGEAVKVGENFGLRITQVGDVKSVIQSMGRS